MAEKKLETFTEVDRSFRLYEYPLPGFSLKYISGPEITKNLTSGLWLNRWENTSTKRVFAFGPEKNLVFTTKEAALAAKAELESAVDVITEVAE